MPPETPILNLNMFDPNTRLSLNLYIFRSYLPIGG